MKSGLQTILIAAMLVMCCSCGLARDYCTTRAGEIARGWNRWAVAAAWQPACAPIAA